MLVILKRIAFLSLLTIATQANAVQLIIVPDGYDRNDMAILNYRLHQQQLAQQKLDAVQETYDIAYEGNQITNINTRKKINRAFQKLDKRFIERPGMTLSNIDMNNVFYEVGDAINKRFYQSVTVNPTVEYIITFTDGTKLTAKSKSM
jgi:hypothetical protein